MSDYWTGKLSRIEKDITNGLKYKSADRIRNWINQHPHELDLRKRLGELYYEGGFLDAAGRYWIFIESDNPEVKRCVDIYRQSVKNSGTQILLDLKYRGSKEYLPPYAQGVIEQLEKDSLERSNYVPSFKPKSKYQPPIATKSIWPDWMVGSFISLIVLLFLVSLVVGLIKVIGWLFTFFVWLF